MEQGFYYGATATEGRTKAVRRLSAALLSLCARVTGELNSFHTVGSSVSVLAAKIWNILSDNQGYRLSFPGVLREHFTNRAKSTVNIWPQAAGLLS